MIQKCSLCNKPMRSNKYRLGSSCATYLAKKYGLSKKKKMSYLDLTMSNALKFSACDKLKLNDIQKAYISNRYYTYKLLEEFNYYDFSKLKEGILSEIENAKDKKSAKFDFTKSITLDIAYKINIISATFDKVKKEYTNKLYKVTDIFEIIWPNMRYLFSSKLLKNNEFVKFSKEMQYLFWKYVAVEIVLKKYFNQPFAAKLLENALNSNPTNIVITEDEYVIDLIKKDSKFKQKINQIIFSQKENFNIKDYIIFEQADLFNSIHKANLYIKGIKQNNLWDLDITISDEYDFTEFILKDYFKNSIIANNCGFISYGCGVINKFNVEIKFKIDNFKLEV